MRNRHKKPTRTVILSVVTAVVLMTIGGVMHYKLVSDRQSMITMLNQKLERTRTERPKLDRLMSEIEVLDASLRELQTSVPEESDLGSLLEQLSRDLGATDVTDEAIVVQTNRSSGPFNRIPLDLRFDGGFLAMFNFMRRIETYDRIVRVDRIQIGFNRSNAEKPLRIDMQLSAYYRSAEGGTP